MVNGWWILGFTAAAAVLGALASFATRSMLSYPRAVLASWWLGALATGVLTAVLSWRVGMRGELAVYTVFAILAVPLAVIDWTEHRLPRILMWPQLAFSAIGFIILCITRDNPSPGIRALCALLAAAGFFLLLAILTSGGIGAGDVSLAAVVGLVTGWDSWATTAVALILASLLALALTSVPQVRSRDEKGRAAIPFGPCMLLGTLAAIAVLGG